MGAPGCILAIESSCDESALALFDPARGLAGEWVHTQLATHQPYGGVVPDLASREHLQHLPALLKVVLEQLDGHVPAQVAVTCGPGLAGCLALGLAQAKALTWHWQRPLVGINHLRGHALSPFIALHAADPQGFEAALDAQLPHLGLLVSGGNTLLFEVDAQRRLRVLAETVDDAAGEALDKGAKLLGFPYPGGPRIEATAAGGDGQAYAFPRSFLHTAEPRFSFSGLKTALRYTVEALDDAALERALPNLCASYQQAVIEALIGKTRQVLRAQPGRWRSLGLSGGVANNTPLRAAFTELAEESEVSLWIAERRHTGDNAAMIAFAAHADPAGHLRGGVEGLSFDPALRLA